MAEHAASIFAEMSKLAHEVGAINLGQGFPDVDGPQALKDEAIAAILDGRGNQYPPANGIMPLREAIASHQQRLYGIALDPHTDVVVTTGASEALVSAIMALVDEGDEVVVFEPWFDIYTAAISMARGVRVSVPMSGPDLRPDIDALRAAMSPRTRLILLNSPHNPTGVVFTPDELAAIAAIAIERDCLVLSDEAYEQLWFDGHRHVPISTLPGMFERTVTVGSGGKSFSFTGWKVGWATGPAHLIGAVRVVRQHLTFVSGGPFQWAMAVGLGLPDEHFARFRAELTEQRDLLAGGLRSIGLHVLDTEGTYFITTDVRPLGYADGLAFCRDIPMRARVVAIPHQGLCDDPSIGGPYVRWAFCKKPEVLSEAITRLQAGFPG
jgi:N-succinyldiaminopimelate aminotransferase